MTFSVLVVLYNAPEAAQECLASLDLGHRPDMEAIVIDNASPLGPPTHLAEWFPRIDLILSAENVGFARAVNQAARRAKGEYLFLLNPDSFLRPGNDAPTILARWLAERPQAGAAGPRLVNPDGTLQTSAYRFPTLAQSAAHLFNLKRLIPVAALRRFGLLAGRFGQFDPHDRARVVDYCTGAALMVKRAAWDRVGGLDERFFLYYEEKDLCLRLRQAGYETHFVPQAEVGHRVGASSETAPELATLARYRSMLAYFAKHKPGQTPILKLLLALAALSRAGLHGLAGHPQAARTWRRVAALAKSG